MVAKTQTNRSLATRWCHTVAFRGIFAAIIVYILPFNLENIYYFSSCSGGTISLHHSITPSLLHFPLDIWKPGGGNSRMKRQGIKGCSSENLNLTPKGD